jgi:hypothetical protein
MRRLRAWLGTRLRRVVAESVTSALAPANAHLQQIDARAEAVREASERDLALMRERLDALDGRTGRIELDVQALRQQVDEALDFLRVQHFAVREALGLSPGGGASDPPAEPIAGSPPSAASPD